MRGAGLSRLVLLVAPLAAVAVASAQPVPGTDAAAEPIRCWWRADRGAVAVGEPLAVVLTCAVADTPALRVVVDRARLDPAVVALAPFEVVGGSQAADLVRGPRRFFQYRYELTLVDERAIGRDLLVPELTLTYRVETRTDGAVVRGRDETYGLPAIPVRVVSLVPSGAAEIREPDHGSLAALDARELRGRLLGLAGLTCLALAAVAAGAAIRLAWVGGRRRADAPVRASDKAILRAAATALAEGRGALRRDPADEAAAGRTLAALRVLAGYAIGRPPVQQPASATDPLDGQIEARASWLRRHRVRVSSPATTAAVVQHAAGAQDTPPERRAQLVALADAMGRLTRARYGAASPPDLGGLEEALAGAASLARDLARRHGRMAWLSGAIRRAAASIGADRWTR